MGVVELSYHNGYKGNGMRMQQPLIITAAIVGAEVTKKAAAAFYVTPQEIIGRRIKRCREAVGASVFTCA